MSRTLDALKRAEAETKRNEPKLLDSGASGSKFFEEVPDSECLTIELQPSPTVEEKYQKLRGALFGRSKTEHIKTLLVVASHHGEGATTTATFLASVLAKANGSRVLLVDANLRTPSPLSLHQLDRGSQGFTELVLGKALLSAVVRQASSMGSNLSVITSGGPVPSPSYIFDGHSIDTVLEALAQRYDYVILDGAPVKDFSDSCFLSSRVDGTVIVVEAGKTRLETVHGTKSQLERYGAKVLGTVFNKKPNYIPGFLERFL
jgi:capsular exopolysaccharide synthesis family protein